MPSMRIGPIPESMIDRVALGLNLGPQPLLDTQLAFTLARVVMAATSLGVFEEIGRGARTPEEVAHACGLAVGPTRRLLRCLAGIDYATHSGGRFELAPRMRKWLLRSSKVSIHDKLVFQLLEWDWVGRMEEWLKSGEGLALHSQLDPTQWALYQRAMYALSVGLAPEVGLRMPVPKQATRMLDIGGSHGLYSAAVCKRHARLTSTILELPEAIEEAAKLLAQHDLGGRITHRAGNALTDDLGESAYDVVFAANVVHHFTEAECADLTRRVARALRPGGVFAIGEFARRDDPRRTDAAAALSDVYFGMISTSGTWSIEEMASWMTAGGLTPKRPIKMQTLPGFVLAAGVKPAAGR